MPVPAEYQIFPVLNAALNGISMVLLLAGHWMIRRGRVGQHRLLMLTAFGTSTLFLISYVYYHLHVGEVRFQGTGWTRPVYFTILISHVLLAIVIVPVVLVTLTRALRGRFDQHRAVARWTYPLWLYVSVTGVLVYFMLYRWFAT
jgi:uncharacterized membrane protein YozB (DUF420 family)